MMGVDTAFATKIVLRGLRAEPVERQRILACSEAKVFQQSGDCDRTAHPTDRTVATPRCVEPIEQADLKANGAAVTLALVWRVDLCIVSNTHT